jgi:ribosomal-protein-serine acetyltransferase
MIREAPPGVVQDMTVRPARASDAVALYEAVVESRAELERWMTWCHPEYGEGDALAWASSREAAFAAGDAYEFVILDPAGGLLGVCGINSVSAAERTANFGYWVRTSVAGRGLATRAARQVVEFAFRETPLTCLEIRCAHDNVRSQRVAEKLGATRIRELPGCFILKGEAHDAVLFRLHRPRQDA